MADRHSEEFKRDAARIALTSGLHRCPAVDTQYRWEGRRQASADLAVGLSTLNKWVKAFSEEAAPAGPNQDLVRENDRLRRENRILKEEREVLKKAAIRWPAG
jgi:transposase